MRETRRSSMWVRRSETWPKESRNPVQEWISNSRSGRSILGGIASVVAFSQVRDSGSPTAPSLSTDRRARPPRLGTMISTFASASAS